MLIQWIQKKRGDQSGVALLMVLSALVILTSLMVEFFYNSHVTYNLAFNEKEKAQAYYLAQSAINFSKLVIRFDQEAKKYGEQASKKLGKTIQVPSLIDRIPISSEILRAGLGGGEDEAPAQSENTEGEEGSETVASGTPNANLSQALNIVDAKAAKEFLSFEGDFTGEIVEEETKLNLNAFYGLVPTQPEYERLKSTLYHLLASDEFKDLFADRYVDARELAQNIADYIDKDDARNEAGEDRGKEGGGSGANVVMKNGKLLSIEELIMVPKMTEEIFQKLKPYVTIYTKDTKINACRAQEPLVTAMILAYTENNPNIDPVKDDNTELLKKATEEVINSCPDMNAMASRLDIVLGAKDLDSNSSSSFGSTGSSSTSRRTNSTAASASSFSDWLKNEASVYMITGIGKVNDTEVKVKTIVDTSSGSGNSWKELYWRIE